MIINTEKLQHRRLWGRDYIAEYGTQDHPYSSNYELLTDAEANQRAEELDAIAGDLREAASKLRDLAKTQL
jgi:hypothetical protein